MFDQLGAASQRALDDLLVTGGADDETDAEATESRRSVLNELKADPGAISLESVIAEIAKLERLRNLALPDELFGDVSLKVVERFRQRAAAEAPTELRAHSPALRATLVAALCWLRRREVTDSLVDLLIQVIHKIGVRAEKRGVGPAVGETTHVPAASEDRGIARSRARGRPPSVENTRQEAPMITLRTASTERVTGRGWLLLAIGGTTAIQQLGYLAVGAFLHDIAADVGTTVAVVGQVPALMTLVAAPLTLAVGPVADRVGYRPFLLLAMGAVAVYAAGTALAGDYGLLLAMGLVGAVGRAITSPVAQAVAAANFTGDALRRAMAITIAGGSGAAVVGVPLLTGIAAPLGWRGAFVALALMGASGVALAWLAVPRGGGSGAVDARTLLGQPLAVLAHGPTRGLLLAIALRAGSIWISSRTWVRS